MREPRVAVVFGLRDLRGVNPLLALRVLKLANRLLGPAGLKTIPSMASCFANLHHQSLRPWRPDDEATRKLALLCEKRRKAVDTRTVLSNQLKSELKLFFPPALTILANDLTTALAADFLLAWPNFDSLKKASVNKLRKFFYAHQSRSELKIQERLKCIEAAQPLTHDSAIIETSTIAVRLLAQQLKSLVPFIALYDQLISKLFKGERPPANRTETFAQGVRVTLSGESRHIRIAGTTKIGG